MVQNVETEVHMAHGIEKVQQCRKVKILLDGNSLKHGELEAAAVHYRYLGSICLKLFRATNSFYNLPALGLGGSIRIAPWTIFPKEGAGVTIPPDTQVHTFGKQTSLPLSKDAPSNGLALQLSRHLKSFATIRS